MNDLYRVRDASVPERARADIRSGVVRQRWAEGVGERRHAAAVIRELVRARLVAQAAAVDDHHVLHGLLGAVGMLVGLASRLVK